jgi:hypothetical protein
MSISSIVKPSAPGWIFPVIWTSERRRKIEKKSRKMEKNDENAAKAGSSLCSIHWLQKI